ncbi:MAG: bifunctional heptose 7-phosphate kinase/heptose 1-phosphate adenyltransferase, partial [Pseudomonadales bacterium]|nr:bifunctional heptose 7-phosphate kinase/heptose 1-phosphate adenyltransferase [Pseudomonadales bacterium]
MNLPRFDKASVLTLGDAMLDRYWYGSTSRISAEAPVPVVEVADVEDRLGGAANVALNIAALGAASYLVSVAGSDESGTVIRRKLASAGIHDGVLALDDYRTVTKLRLVSQGQQMIRADFEDIRDIEPALLLPAYLAALDQVQGVILSDYDKGAVSDPAPFIDAARRAGRSVLVDPKHKDFTLYAGATIIKPNKAEFRKAVGSWATEAELVEKCHRLIDQLGLEAMLVTRDSDGMTL